MCYCYSVYHAALASQIATRFAFLGMRPLRAAALPANAAHIINIRSYQPLPQYGKWYRIHISATPVRTIFALCITLKISVRGRAKLHLRRFETSQM